MLIAQFLLKSSAYLIVILLAGLWLKPHAAFEHLPVESTPWQIPSSQPDAILHTPNIERLESGQYRLNYSINLEGVTPRALHWFIQNQANHFAYIDEKKIQWFQLSHPHEHNKLLIIDSPDAQSDQLHAGTVFEVQEQISEQNWRMRMRVRSFGEQGMDFDVIHSGYKVGELSYVFYPTPNGTQIDFSGTLGLDIPVLGDISNFYLFKKVMPEDLLDVWVLHNLETYQHMEKLIPILYRQRDNKQFSLS